jgi:hypothetical protein
MPSQVVLNYDAVGNTFTARITPNPTCMHAVTVSLYEPPAVGDPPPPGPFFGAMTRQTAAGVQPEIWTYRMPPSPPAPPPVAGEWTATAILQGQEDPNPSGTADVP